MGYLEEYKRWLSSPAVDENTKKELIHIESEDDEIRSRFSSMLEFGTAGLRGIMGAGTFRMNFYTVRYITQGICDLIQQQGETAMQRGCVIAYDCRIHSREFAEAACGVFTANGIKSYIFDELRPTPELSFSVRELHTIAGINITASHNPKEYNGYKVYWEDGAQLSPEHADIVAKKIGSKDIFDDVRFVPFEEGLKSGLTQIVGKELDDKFLDNVLSQVVNSEAILKVSDTFKIVYTPFHGAGYQLVPRALKAAGMKHILTVDEQMIPDGNFPTVKSPNPEEKEGFYLAVDLAKKNDVDLIIGTDPDSDRVGIVVRNRAGEYVNLTGNQVGALLTDYIIKAMRNKGILPGDAMVVSTIVSTKMAEKICKVNGVEIKSVFTGFKYIGEKIKEAEESGKGSFIFGFEESYGYMKGTYCRDKDGVVTSLIICEMACFYKEKGMTLYDALNSLYEQYGYYCDKSVSILMDGLDGLTKIKNKMSALRHELHREIAGLEVKRFRDYGEGYILDYQTGEKLPADLPNSNVLFYELDDASFIIRPSGTEPKIKFYVLVGRKTLSEAQEISQRLEKAGREMLK